MARYDISTDRWGEVAPLPIAVNHPASPPSTGASTCSAATVGGAGERKSRRLYRYEPGRDRWTRLPDAPTARGALALGRRSAAGCTPPAATRRPTQRLRRLEIYDVDARPLAAGPDDADRAQPRRRGA